MFGLNETLERAALNSERAQAMAKAIANGETFYTMQPDQVAWSLLILLFVQGATLLSTPFWAVLGVRGGYLLHGTAAPAWLQLSMKWTGAWAGAVFGLSAMGLLGIAAIVYRLA